MLPQLCHPAAAAPTTATSATASAAGPYGDEPHRLSLQPRPQLVARRWPPLEEKERGPAQPLAVPLFLPRPSPRSPALHRLSLSPARSATCPAEAISLLSRALSLSLARSLSLSHSQSVRTPASPRRCCGESEKPAEQALVQGTRGGPLFPYQVEHCFHDVPVADLSDLYESKHH
jgi:hypothetical protein